MSNVNYAETIIEMGAALLGSFRELIKKADFDKTFKAKVTARLSPGTYRILHRGTEYSAAYSGSLAIGQIVYVRAPQNNWDELYITADSPSIGVE